MKLNKRESPVPAPNSRSNASKSNNSTGSSSCSRSRPKSYQALHDAYNPQHRNSGGHQYFNDVDYHLCDFHEGSSSQPHEHADSIFDPPPIGKDTGGDAAHPWLGLHLEQQTVIMKQWATERKAMAEENDRLRQLLADAEERIKELEIVVPLAEAAGADTDLPPGCSGTNGEGNGLGSRNNSNASSTRGHLRAGSATDYGSVCSAASTVIAGTAASKSVFASSAKYPRSRTRSSASGVSSSLGNAKQLKGSRSSEAEPDVGVRRTAERCKEGYGGGGGKKKKKRFFGRTSRSNEENASKPNQNSNKHRRSRSYSPNGSRAERKKNYNATKKVTVTRVDEEESYEDIAISPSTTCTTDDDDTVGISDHTVSPPATPERLRSRSLSPIPFLQPSSRDTRRLQQRQEGILRTPSNESSQSSSTTDPLGKETGGSVNTQLLKKNLDRHDLRTGYKLHRTASLPVYNNSNSNARVIKKVALQSRTRTTTHMIEKKGMVPSSFSQKKIVLSKVTGINGNNRSRSTINSSSSDKNKKITLNPVRSDDVEVVGVVSSLNKESNAIVVYGRDHLPQDNDDNALVEI